VRVHVAYDPQRTPPAPILPIRLGRPGTNPNVLLVALVDTGADATVIPSALALRLDLPVLADVAVAGPGGLSQRAMVYAAVVEVGGSQWPIQVLALGGEALAGRDLLNQWIATLRGPAQILEIETPARSS
jgi:predicted aspartyl protease